jgi:diadenosine tetraphosphate (Ap4A) HIT family hydrolase
MIEARRHFLDFGEMTRAEGIELISILQRLVPAIKDAMGAERVYSITMMEGVPHFHLWLVPRRKRGRLRGVKYLASRSAPPSRARARRAAGRIRVLVRSEGP